VSRCSTSTSTTATAPEHFYDRSDVLFVSLHGEPAVSYPYFSGYATKSARVSARVTTSTCRCRRARVGGVPRALLHACKKLRQFALIAGVSLGVDTFKDDPISHFQLESEDFIGIGRDRQCRLPHPVRDGGRLHGR
jgi:acetoin utilization deacetylase AcuC-like enzyme